MGERDAVRITERVRRAARDGGARLVGFADVEGIAELPRAVVFGMPHSPAVLSNPTNMSNRAYSDEYFELNRRLTGLAREIGPLLAGAGFEAHPHPATLDKIDPERLIAPFPHKTAATRAELGWIGKSALLVTEELGPALRLTSVLTEAPLVTGTPVTGTPVTGTPVTGTPVTESRCGDCALCVEACPGQAITGEHWHAGRPREDLLDAHACHRTCGDRSRAAGIGRGSCGVCMAVCPLRPQS